ncbi:MAG: tyrosine--tRNA ligase [Candidatus Andersenbacteria bacterium CG10_big_fil_rev_8_21_14_0_10_54_11]|uniref:tyrosine--tRNA ligase n=1 Tax=Candidatus Andersenbacteria bacterium CG10_big_fil_rev_8_21_14_0_10_54_11 TaxID=1974485 RepID=A0A2M6WZS5_9BACT|nr:MAG: tyrosine--tRNA ligase [Candidatus Andersenbacteria bacterium CG10_big_fil_rev_8_21_14_0_10_54_11]
MAEKEQIITRLANNLAEIITEDELRQRLASGDTLTHYIGFEISGYVHIGQGIMSALVMKDLTDLGVKCTVWLADWHTWINGKLDGNKTTAARIGQGYFTEAMKACFHAVGGDPDKLEFRLASEWYQKNAYQYLELEKLIEKNTSLSRMQRSISIMGKEEGSEIDFASLTYPAMQVADIYYQNIDIVHAAMDQRKAHVIMRDVAEKIAPGKPKPVALHHPLIASLDGQNKMSKSRPDSAVFIHDSEEEISRKVKKAFAEPCKTAGNPILNWTRHLLFWNREESQFEVMNEKEGGKKSFASYEELEDAYAAGSVHPADLKTAVTKELIEVLTPVRRHFAKPTITAKKAELDKVLQAR